jgi:hypothetical protein
MGLEWGVHQARLSLFLSEPYAISDKDWANITGQEEAGTRQVVPGGKRLSGPVPNGIMHMSAMGSRFDVILTVADTAASGEVQVPSVGPYNETFTSFFESTSKWIGEANPSTTRVAFGGLLTSRTAGREEAYGHLRDLLRSVKVDPENMRDLEYRVNWPSKSKVQDLVLNRVTTWSALVFSSRLLEVTGSYVQQGGETAQVNAVRLEFDNNTDDANKAIFDQRKLIPIYLELVELARQNAAEGEVPCA